jgi:pimeloyl-ACP methyl ester carboxylesterase
MDATEQFVGLQRRLLAHYGVTASSRFVDLAQPQMRAHVLEAGSGEPLVLIHGGDGEGVNWAALMGLLKSHATLYAVDRPGFGLSDAFDYRGVELRQHAADFGASLLDALGLESATLVGGSMGGFFSLAVALAHPERVRRVVLTGYAVGLVSDVPLPLRIIGGIPGLSQRFMNERPSMEAQLKQYRGMFHVDVDRIPPLYFETRIAGIGLPSEQGTWAALLPRITGLCGLRPGVYLGDDLARLPMPVLVMMGDHDMAPVEAVKAAVAGIPDGRFEFMPGVGHFPYLEAPDRTAELILEHLRR